MHWLLAVLLSIGAAAQKPSRDGWIGVWSQDLNRSRPIGNRSLPKSCLLTIKPWGDAGLSWITDQVNADGTMTQIEVSANFDDSFYPVTGIEGVTGFAFREIDALVLLRRDRRSAPEIHRTTLLGLSRDGETMIETTVDNARPSDPALGFRFFRRQHESR
jgi:hypothetical protein